MNENHKTEIEELLNDLVEGTATERQETEFKRLSKHEPEIIDQLEAMRRHKSLLRLLPIDSAPNCLVDDICSVLERKQILGNFAEDKQTIAGTSHLFLRRIITVAAMFLLPIGLLSFVVYEIIKPASVGPATYVSSGETLLQDSLASIANESIATEKDLPFNGILTFSTEQQVSITNYVEKMIFDQGLINFTIPNRTADTATYQINASPEKVSELIDLLANIWPHCQSVSLSVANSINNQPIEISQVKSEQLAALAFEKSPEMLARLAGQYAKANKEKDILFADADTLPTEQTAIEDIGLYSSPRLRMPILTGNDESISTTVNPSQPTVQLQIQVKSSE